MKLDKITEQLEQLYAEQAESKKNLKQARKDYSDNQKADLLHKEAFNKVKQEFNAVVRQSFSNADLNNPKVLDILEAVQKQKERLLFSANESINLRTELLGRQAKTIDLLEGLIKDRTVLIKTLERKEEKFSKGIMQMPHTTNKFGALNNDEKYKDNPNYRKVGDVWVKLK